MDALFEWDVWFLRGQSGIGSADRIHGGVAEKLVRLSENGSRASYASQQLQAMHALIDACAAASMPFSLVDYPVSSRKRLAEDMRNNLRVTEAIT